MTCNIWVSDTAFETADGESVTVASVYEAIDPSDQSSVISSPLPVGTMLIHHPLNDKPLAVMVKRAPGFAPADNDWWFARYDESGERAPLEPGYLGMTCQQCHGQAQRAERTDLLFGVPH